MLKLLKGITGNWTCERAVGFNMGLFFAFFFAAGMVNGAQGNLGMAAAQFAVASVVGLVAILLPPER